MPDRIVTSLPLATLWDEEGRNTPSHREQAVGAEQIRELLRRDQDLAFVVANLGHPLCRIAGESRFEVWKNDLAPQLIDPATEKIDLDTYPSGVCYAASIWQERGHRVVVLEAHH